MTEEQKETYAEKIAKLLRKAESTTSDAEAEALVAKAQQLMIKWSIDQDMLDRANGKAKQEVVVEQNVTYTGIYHQALVQTGFAIARNMHCRVIQSKQRAQKAWTSFDGVEHPRQKAGTVMHVVGFESDVENVKMIDASVQIQCAQAQQRWWKNNDRKEWMSSMESYKAKREFIFGFARGLSIQLAEANRAAQAESAADEAARHGGGEEAVANANAGVALVVKTKKQQVDDWVDDQYGDSLRSVSHRYSHGGYDAGAAGQSAGKSANVGRSGIGSRKELN